MSFSLCIQNERTRKLNETRVGSNQTWIKISFLPAANCLASPGQYTPLGYPRDLVVLLAPGGSDHDILFKFKVKMRATASMLIKEQSNIPTMLTRTETSAK